MSGLTGEPLRWVEHFQDCLAGAYGPVAMAEAERYLTWAPKPQPWQQWRDFSQETGIEVAR